MLRDSSIQVVSWIGRLAFILLTSLSAMILVACDSTGSSDPDPVPQPPPQESEEGRPVAHRQGKSHALLIAVRQYQESGKWAPLERDLEPLAETLRGLDFEVEVLYDPDGYALEERFNHLTRRQGDREENRVLFFFTGHAYTEGDQAFLLPADTLRPGDDNFFRRTLSLGHIETEALDMAARQGLFLFDSSFSDVAFLDQEPTPSGAGDPDQLGEARQLIAAGQENQPLPRRSTFIPLLIQGLEGRADLDQDRRLTGTELRDWLFEQMPSEGEQEPQFAELGDPEQRSDFVFHQVPSPGQPQGDMQADFSSIRNNESLSPRGKVDAWRRFLDTYPSERNASAEANKLRQRAEVRMDHWAWEANAASQVAEMEDADEDDGERARREQEQREQERREELERERQERLERDRLAQLAEEQPAPEDPQRMEPEEPVQAQAEPTTATEDSSKLAQQNDTQSPSSSDQEEQNEREKLERERLAEERERQRLAEERRERQRQEALKRARNPSGEEEERELLKVADSALLLKVVGLSDNISILQTPGGTATPTATMEPLKPYFVLEDAGEHYRISSTQEEGGTEGYVVKSEVTTWNTREGLHFIPNTLAQQRRQVVEAWSSEERIRSFANSLDLESHGPDFGEELQTRVGKKGAIPYPLLRSIEIDIGGQKRTVHEVLIPTTVALNVVETSLAPEQVREVVGAVTVCVVFDASRSMRAYARTFANTLKDMLDDFSSETRIAVGFILFREAGRNPTSRFEIYHPQNVGEAIEWLQKRVRDTFGGKDSREPEPVLDAMMLSQKSFLWNSRPAIRGASRIAILVANEHAALETQGAARTVEPGMPLEEVSLRLLRNRIKVFSLQAGNEDRGNLVEVLRTLSTETGGEFYRSAVRRGDIREKFTGEIRKVLNRSISDGRDAASRLQLTEREGGGTVIALDALTDALRQRLQEDAREFHVPDGGLLIKKAWVFEQPELYREEILIDKELLKDLITFFNELSAQGSFSTRDFESSMGALLEALIGEELVGTEVGEQLEAGIDIQELLEKAVGANFKTNLMSFPLEYLARLSPEEQRRLQENIRAATGGLREFYEINLRRLENQERIWMPVDYLP